MSNLELMINDVVPYQFGHKIGYARIVGIRIVTDIMAGERTGVFTSQTYTIKDTGDTASIRAGYQQQNFEEAATKRLAYLRKELQAGRMSYEETAELQGLWQYIDDGDVELLEAAGVCENCRLQGHNSDDCEGQA